ncbi:hypothetical protein GCM10028778_14610 [Barrientosiimonas marina]|uniref:Glycoside hydrolase n=1 Tax=Lentibacillus kimchii TaxID=1542911 RepID=A0ABW2UUC6_9BACI
MKAKLLKMPAFGIILAIALLSFAPSAANAEEEDDALKETSHIKRQISLEPIDLDKHMQRFTYDTGLDFDYPDAVRGIYVTGNSAGGDRLDKLVNLVNTSDLNAMVIDIKEDHGNITISVPDDSPYKDAASDFIGEPRELLEYLEEEGIYPIARLVVFKDSVLAEKNPELSFRKNGEIWTNNKGEAFVSPFQKDVWKYNVDLAKKAAELGFQEIQFDYVRFPEGFEKRDDELDYSMGDYKNDDTNNVERRVHAVTDFVEYAKDELDYYDVDVGVDIFGYTATIDDAPGIGQNFSDISNQVDVISSMIYPSHWTAYFGIDFPDKEPYKTVNRYAETENKLLERIDDKPVSRPWIQDFEAPWLYSGAPTSYGKPEVEAQIKALNENGIDEFLLWNAGNSYTENVDYTPLN